MKLIDLYVAEVGRRLPKSMRADVQAELRSTLLDMLDDKAKMTGQDTSEKLEADLLREYGSPEQVARTYQPAQVLIGSELFPTFLVVLKIVLAVTAVLTAIGMGVELGRSAPELAKIGLFMGERIADWIQSMIQAFGMIVIIFAILQRTTHNKKMNQIPWDPSQLSNIPDPDQAKPSHLIVSIILSVFALVIFYVYPDLVAIYYKDGTEWVKYSILTPVFFKYLPWMSVIWIGQIIRDALVLKDGHWSRTTKSVAIGLKVAEIILLVVIISGPSIVTLPLVALRLSTGVVVNNIPDSVINQQFQAGFRVLLGFAAAVTSIETVRNIFRLFK